MRMRALCFTFGVTLATGCAGTSALEAPAPAAKAPVPTAKGIELFDGRSLDGWFADVPAKDENPNAPDAFIVRDGKLVSLGEPRGHLLTKERYKDYRLTVEYRFVGNAGNGGILVHASQPRALYAMFPKSIEVQLHSGDAGDFWCIEEDIKVNDMEARRPRKPGQEWGGKHGDARRILNLTDGSERALGEWNTMVIEAKGRSLDVWVNGTLVNQGYGATAAEGRLAIQAEGTEMEFRTLRLERL